ncbi:hypothetical protein [Cryobacterium psychrophilum]|uniref:AbiEi antitoxin C-terminal domain-containing protein n=1 Tax=Cryobacterium psychrophilum TaxID=41988 RepID=A0A4Y8KNQ2_9MICO|nr:hypothetical protein [Cryobacterium psychrophilum]TFD78881.1 hypothetical protein E3T53_08825 [Cryobacterium psychrophilum]
MTHRLAAALAPGHLPGELPLAELMCASLDGEVYPLGACWCPIDQIDGPSLRAASLAPLVPARGIIERASAAWVYGFLAEPREHELCVDVHARAHVLPSTHVHLREVVCSDVDIRALGGLRVTTPLRTVVDLAHANPALGRGALTTVLWALLRYGGFHDVVEARRACTQRSGPHRARALAQLDLVAARFSEPVP